MTRLLRDSVPIMIHFRAIRVLSLLAFSSLSVPAAAGVQLVPFVTSGLSSPLHRRWQSQWEDLYTPLGIEFYAILGNHDTRDSASPYAQVLRTKRSASWRMPAAYYTFSARGTVRPLMGNVPVGMASPTGTVRCCGPMFRRILRAA